MINLVFVVKSEQGLENILKTLEWTLPDLEEDTSWLFMVKSEFEGRLSKGIMTSFQDAPLTEWKQFASVVGYDKGCALNLAKKHLDVAVNEKVFVSDGELVLLPGQINRLAEELKVGVGFVSGVPIGEKAYRYKDIYADKRYKHKVPLPELLTEVDSVPPDWLITFGGAFLEQDWSENNFGLLLRRQGYRNYVDTSIKCRS